MKLKSLTISGFRSFLEPQTLDLSELEPGLYLVAGDNKLEPALGGNGAGKSSLWEALYWALSGTTSRKLKAGAVKCWAGGDCRVEAVFDEGELERTWSPNTLKWQGRLVDQETLEQELVSPEVALSTFYFAQFSPFFLDKPPAARMEIYSEVLGLEMWEQKSDQAKALANEADSEAQQMEIEKARIEAKITTLESQDFRVQSAEWDKDHNDHIKTLKASLAEHAKNQEHAWGTVEELQREYEGVEQEAARFKERLKAAKAAEIKANQKYIEAVTQMARLHANMGSAQAAWTKGKRLTAGATCSECGQVIPRAHVKEHLAKLQERAEETKADHDRYQRTQTSIRKAYDDAKVEVAKVSSEDPAAALAVLEQKHGVAHREALAIDDHIKRAERDLKKAQQEKNPFDAQAAANAATIKTLKAELKEVTSTLDETRLIQGRLEFWIKGFKEVRYQVIQESIAQLNAEANECLHAFGLEGWALQFGVEKETKSGTVKRGFMCNVLSPYTDEAVPWEAWSGGETQRLRLAGQLGVTNLLCSRMGKEFDWEVWDEPSNWVTPEGVKALLDVLRERAERYGKRIFIMEHHSMDWDFDGILMVTKTEEGSKISLEV